VVYNHTAEGIDAETLRYFTLLHSWNRPNTGVKLACIRSRV